MKYKVNVSECYYNVSNDNLISKIIEADNVFNLIEKIEVDNDLSEYVDKDYSVDKFCDVNEGNKSFYLLLNEVFEFECELLN